MENDRAGKRFKSRRKLLPVLDVLKSAGILAAMSGIGLTFRRLGFAEANIIMVYVLGVLIISVVTEQRIYSLIASGVSVLIFNFLFAEPEFTLRAYGLEYPVTFVIMFLSALLTGSLAVRMKNSARQSAKAEYRTRILFDTSQLIQHAQNRDEIVSAAAKQLRKLLGKEIVFYPAENGRPGEPVFFSAGKDGTDADSPGLTDADAGAAAWAMKHSRDAGAETDVFPEAKCRYLSVRVNDRAYGVVGIVMDGEPLTDFENSILLAILGECALALENEKNAKEKEEAAVLARNEQIKANILRTISHDLRTPLTSISGNASNLLSNGEAFDEETKKSLYLDIYEDSMWLINLVENLLAVSRLEEGRLNLRVSEDLVEDAVSEALHHINRRSVEHHILVEHQEEFLIAKMDARLIVQVIINLVDNAVKYTPKGSHIWIRTGKEEDRAVISVADDGSGIPDKAKPRIFDMFYSASNRIADSRRSLGLGLSLCKSIVNAHGGTISVSDNVPHGAVFTFTLPAGEVQIHE